MNQAAPSKRKFTVKVIAAMGGGLLLLCIVCVAGVAIFAPDSTSTPVAQENAGQVQAEDMAAEVLAATNTKVPTKTPAPSRTPRPTNIPRPTNTPAPTATPTPVPQPIVLNGSGDSVIDMGIESLDGIAVAHIIGNKNSNHFAVTSQDANGNQVELLVNTTDPYDGFVPVNFRSDENATRLEIKSEGDWEITLLPVAPGFVNTMDVPGSLSGSGDNVIFLSGGTPDLAKITGNAGAHHFAVIALGDDIDLLVNTTDPYEGTVSMPGGTLALQIDSEDEWTIEITGR